MANVYTMDSDAGSFALMGRASPGVVNHVMEGLRNFSSNLAAQGQDIVNRYSAQINDFMTGTLTRRIDAVTAQIRGALRTDGIYYMDDISFLQNPPEAMVKYLVAAPPLRQYLRDDIVSGYGDRFIYDADTSDRILDQTERLVTSGMLQLSDEHGMSKHWNIPDATLDFYSKTSIVRSWDLMKQALEDDIDPTSSWNDPVG